MSLCEGGLWSSIVFEACAWLIESLWARVLVTQGSLRTWEAFEQCGLGPGANASPPSGHLCGSAETHGGDCFACGRVVFVTEMSRVISNGGKKWRQLGEVAVVFFLFLSTPLLFVFVGVSRHCERCRLKTRTACIAQVCCHGS